MRKRIRRAGPAPPLALPGWQPGNVYGAYHSAAELGAGPGMLGDALDCLCWPISHNAGPMSGEAGGEVLVQPNNPLRKEPR